MSNFSPKIKESSEEQLHHLINESNLQFGALASDELTRRSIIKLNESIDKGTLQTQESSDRMEKITWAFLILALVQFLVAVFQLILSFAYSESTQTKILGITMVVSVGAFLTYLSVTMLKKK